MGGARGGAMQLGIGQGGLAAVAGQGAAEELAAKHAADAGVGFERLEEGLQVRVGVREAVREIASVVGVRELEGEGEGEIGPHAFLVAAFAVVVVVSRVGDVGAGSMPADGRALSRLCLVKQWAETCPVHAGPLVKVDNIEFVFRAWHHVLDLKVVPLGVPIRVEVVLQNKIIF